MEGLNAFCKNHVKNNDIQQKIKNLKKLKYEEQKSEGWLNQRYDYITASDISVAIRGGYFKSRDDFIREKTLRHSSFKGNEATRHGSKYEEVASLMIEYIDKGRFKEMLKDSSVPNIDIVCKYFNIDEYFKVHEFGMIPHPTIKFIGASPDGIQMSGHMKEIKCPKTRKISNTVPKYYREQMYSQMECADLDYCDFFQAKIVEYKNRKEYLSEGREFKRDGTGLFKGCIIKKGEEEYIYPPCLDMSYGRMNRWIKKNRVDKDGNPREVIYWKLLKYTYVLVRRDEQWLDDNMDALTETWKAVENRRDSNYYDNIRSEYSEYEDSSE